MSLDVIALATAALVGALDGATEFLPVSSDGHLAIAGAFLGLTGGRLAAVHAAIEPAVALGAVTALLRRGAWRRVRAASAHDRRQAVVRVVLGLLPLAIVACVYPRVAQGYFLGGTAMVALTFLGGFALLAVDRRVAAGRARDTWLALRHREALLLGALDLLGAMLPGLGRACAILAGARGIGLARAPATEFSVVVSILSLTIGGIASLRDGVTLSTDAVGFVIACAIYAFAAAHLMVGWLIGFAPARGFVPLAWYRFAFGFVVAATLVSGIVKWTP